MAITTGENDLPDTHQQKCGLALFDFKNGPENILRRNYQLRRLYCEAGTFRLLLSYCCSASIIFDVDLEPLNLLHGLLKPGLNIAAIRCVRLI
jgi:hypothetical protein